MKILWYWRASEDLGKATDYIAKDNPRAAAKVRRRLLKAVEHLKLFPHAGRLGRIALTREIIISDYPFIIRYRIKGSVVQILRVFHCAREWVD